MISKRSRYAKTPVTAVVDATGDASSMIELRAFEPAQASFSATPRIADRLDLLAHRYYRDSLRWWRICDASEFLDPLDVVAPGEPLPVPPDK